MAEQRTKLQTYTQMAEDNSAVVTGSFSNWASLLSTVGRFYEYSFLEALMIHLQRPEATACAEYSVWSEQMHRYVRRNAKGIAVIRLIDDKPTLRYSIGIDTNRCIDFFCICISFFCSCIPFFSVHISLFSADKTAIILYGWLVGLDWKRMVNTFPRFL